MLKLCREGALKRLSSLGIGIAFVMAPTIPSFAQSAPPPSSVQPLPPDEFPETLSRMPRAHAEEFTSDEDKAAWAELLKVAPAVADKGGSLGPSGTRSHVPSVAVEYRKVFRLLQTSFGFSPPELEFIILVACRYSNNETEWGDHAPLALKAGIPAEIIEMVRLKKFDLAKLNEKQKATIALAEELAASPPQRVDSKTFKQLQDAYGQKEALGVTVLISYYTANAVILHTYDQKVDLSKRTRPYPDLEKIERKD